MAFQVYTIFIIHKTVIVYISDTFHPFDLRRKHRLGTNSQGCSAIWNESRNHIKQTSKQKHFSTTTPCKPPSWPFAIVSIHQFLHAFFSPKSNNWTADSPNVPVWALLRNRLDCEWHHNITRAPLRDADIGHENKDKPCRCCCSYICCRKNMSSSCYKINEWGVCR